jgi:outer membrane protein assembly factor BamB
VVSLKEVPVPPIYDCQVYPRKGRRSSAVSAALACVAIAACGASGSPAASSSTRPASTSTPQSRAARAGTTTPGGDWTTFDYDAQRSGIGPASTGITPGNLGLLRRRTLRIGGTVDSSPVELHAVRVRGRVRDVVIVTTTYGRTLALAPNSGERLWQFQPPGYRTLAGSAQITTATPVIDPDRHYVYAASPTGMIYKLAVSNGHPVWSVRITFDATHEKIAGALNLAGNSVVAVTGGYYGDAPPYQGHVVLINRASGRITAVFNTLCSGHRGLIDPPRSCSATDSAIWARSGSVIEPDGNVLVATGNGPFDGSANWGDSVLELSRGLRLLHNYTPTNQAALNQNDADLGSGSPALLGNVGGTNLAVTAGKDGILRLLNLDRLDGTGGRAGPKTGGELQLLAAPGSAAVFTASAVWHSGGHVNVFVATTSGTADYVLTASKRLRVAWQNGTPGTSPLLAGGLLYVYDQVDGALDIYSPTSGRRLAQLPAATGHWNSPIVVGGRIIVPEGDANNHATTGTIDIYHLPG